MIIHAGSLSPLAELLRDVNSVRMTGVPFDLYVNLASGKIDEANAIALIKEAFPLAIIITSENRGMDIGGFLKMLPLVFSASQKYDYVLKLHTKSASGWRRSLITPICGNSHQVKLCLQIFQTQSQVGMIGSGRHLYRETRHKRPNCYYLQQLATDFKVPYGDCQFIGGTMFWIRTSLLENVFHNQDIEVLWNKLNTPQTLDPHWYLVNYHDTGVATVTQARQHWELQGKEAGRYCNCLDARERGSNKYVADGMLEHAMERFFGLVTKVQGKTVIGL